MSLEDDFRVEANRAKAKQYGDESFQAILADQFWKNEKGKTNEFKAIVEEVKHHPRLITPEQQESVMNALRDGKAMTVEEAIELLGLEDTISKNTHTI